MSKAYGSVPAISTEETPFGMSIAVRHKQGHSCCMGCCDVRRAVIIVDTIMIIFLLIDIFGILSLSHQQPLDDDEVEKAVEKLRGFFGIGVFIIEILLLAISISGAVAFSAQRVLVGLAVFGVGAIMSLIQFTLPAVVVSTLFAYPHYFLYKEINEGIMTAENYYNEEQSCCCV